MLRTLSLLFLFIPTTSLFAADNSPELTDPSFHLWCGALTCIQTKIENSTFVTSGRQFLGIAETGLPQGAFDRDCTLFQDDEVLAPQETVFTGKEDESNKIYDRRLLRRWRYVDGDGVHDESEYKIEIQGRDHVDQLFAPYDSYPDDYEGDRFITFKKAQLPGNSVPCEGGYYLHPGVCADASEKLWVMCDVLETIDKSTMPVSLMWVEQFKKPFMLKKLELPVKCFFRVLESAAVKFVDNDSLFQIYYDAGITRSQKVSDDVQFTQGTATIIYKPVAAIIHEPEYKIVTYALDRVKKQLPKIDRTQLAKWYQTYTCMKEDRLEKTALDDTVAEMCAAINHLDPVQQ